MVLQYKLVYRKGKDNTAADAPSRQPSENELFVISLCCPRWLESIVDGYAEDAKAKALLQELSITSPNPRCTKDVCSFHEENSALRKTDCRYFWEILKT